MNTGDPACEHQDSLFSVLRGVDVEHGLLAGGILFSRSKIRGVRRLGRQKAEET